MHTFSRQRLVSAIIFPARDKPAFHCHSRILGYHRTDEGKRRKPRTQQATHILYAHTFFCIRSWKWFLGVSACAPFFQSLPCAPLGLGSSHSRSSARTHVRTHRWACDARTCRYGCPKRESSIERRQEEEKQTREERREKKKDISMSRTQRELCVRTEVAAAAAAAAARSTWDAAVQTRERETMMPRFRIQNTPIKKSFFFALFIPSLLECKLRSLEMHVGSALM